MDMDGLTKQERKEQIRLQIEKDRKDTERRAKMKKLGIRGGILLVLLVLGYFGLKELFKPLPGTLYPDLGRDHVNDISDKEYNSNPPTSGPHFPAWAKKGVYDRVISDGYLIHSLEHGYIVISYDCTEKFSSFHFPVSIVEAQGDKPVDEENQMEDGKEIKPLTKMTVIPTDKKSWITPDDEPGIEVELPQEFNSDSCKSLVKDLSQFTNEWARVVVVPRVGMDHPIILTAWRRLETLDSVDKGKITDFIKAFHNRGPEQTME